MTKANLQIVMYKPEIPQNVGAAIRLCACMNATLHLIKPFGFILDNKRLFPLSQERRSFLDYWNKCRIIIHDNWEDFILYKATYIQGRIVAFTPHTDLDIKFVTPNNNDILVFGRESDGFDEKVHSGADVLAYIPVSSGCRSLNVCSTMSIVMGFWR
jgi:tRNA (cytidine/uridine-2'-O-)-methyltransferase